MSMIRHGATRLTPRAQGLFDAYGVRHTFSDQVLEEDAAIQTAAATLKADQILSRQRHFMGITLDTPGAHEEDDGITVEKNSDHTFTVFAHVSDVTAYFPLLDSSGRVSAINREAALRSASIYGEERLHIPMLPAGLVAAATFSDQDKHLALTVKMAFDASGHRVGAAEIFESLFESRRALHFKRADQILNGKGKPCGDEVVRNTLSNLRDVGRALYQRRRDLDENVEVPRRFFGDPSQRFLSGRYLAEIMLEANLAVAEWFFERPAPLIYRCHDDIEKEGESENDFQDLLAKRDDEKIALYLRQYLKRAYYSVDASAGHSALGVEQYTHFTSPMRRFPDQMAHRIIKYFMHGGSFDDSAVAVITNLLERVAVHASVVPLKVEAALKEIPEIGLIERESLTLDDLRKINNEEELLQTLKIMLAELRNDERGILITYFKRNNFKFYLRLLNDLAAACNWGEREELLPDETGLHCRDRGAPLYGKRFVFKINGEKLTPKRLAMGTKNRINQIAAEQFIKAYLLRDLVDPSRVNNRKWPGSKAKSDDLDPRSTIYQDLLRMAGKEDLFYSLDFRVEELEGGRWKAVGSLVLRDEIEYQAEGETENEALERCAKKILATLEERNSGLEARLRKARQRQKHRGGRRRRVPGRI